MAAVATYHDARRSDRGSEPPYPRGLEWGLGMSGQERPSLTITGVAEQIIPVILGERSYDIVLQPGLLATVGERLHTLTTSPRIGVVTDRHVAHHYLQGAIC